MAHEIPNSSAQQLSFMAKPFANPISIKLDEENFLTWKHQALFAIKAHKLGDHLVKEKVPEKYVSEEDRVLDNASATYFNWENQDQHLATWLLASLDPTFCSRVVGCEYVHQIWSKIEVYFASKTCSKVEQLRIQLKEIRKQGNTASEYLLKIERIVDSLAVVGAPNNH